MGARLKAELRVKARIRACEVAGFPAFLRRRGERDAGGILIKVARLDGRALLYEPTMGPDGGSAWLCSSGAEPATEAHVETMLARRLATDPDLWVIEIEDREGRWQPGEPVIDLSRR